MMMTFVNMDAPGITILPTHRVVFGLKDFKPAEFLASAQEFFTVTPLEVPTPDALMMFPSLVASLLIVTVPP